MLFSERVVSQVTHHICPDQAGNDFLVHFTRMWDFVEAGYDTQLSDEVKRVCMAYADGLNYFAYVHPKKVITEELFPVTPDDIVASLLHKNIFFTGLDTYISNLMAADQVRTFELFTLLTLVPTLQSAKHTKAESDRGSNSFAVGPGMTIDGSTLLLSNSHQPWSGPFSWYEVCHQLSFGYGLPQSLQAHAHSEEGWDTTGGLFPGCPFILMGHNREARNTHLSRSSYLFVRMHS